MENRNNTALGAFLVVACILVADGGTPAPAHAQGCGTIHPCGPLYDHVNEVEASDNHARNLHDDCFPCVINF